MSLTQIAIDTLAKNDRGGFTIPTAGLYPYQWNWDSAFIALGIATYDMDRAWAEVTSLLEGQWPDGMIPSIIFRSDDPDYFPGPSRWGKTPGPIPSTGVSQPPVLTTAVMQLTGTGSNRDTARRAEVFDQLFAYHKWFHDNRTAKGIVATVHPWETGRDNCPEWNIGLDLMQVAPDLAPYTRMDNKHVDASFRPTQEQYDKYLTIIQFGQSVGWDQRRLTEEGPFLMADPNIHFILLRADKDLLAMARDLGKSADVVAAIEGWIAKGEAASDFLWSEELGAFTARDIRTGAFSKGFSNCSPLCFYADTGTPEQRARILENLQRIASKVDYMLPSWDPDADEFEPQRYWCGPVWPQMNFMVAQGLAETGEDTLAQLIRDDLCRAIEKSGFWECFNPLTGEGCVGKNFSWTAAVWLSWQHETKLKGVA
ncbi:MGH1-like glycoside hydrolase domain-containing protein [Algirhabdus cladophorae]|uniref:MGH1-like glycoside hydrolase domain-containing protein n=1 Tax=Algirhabdus cladophorae TaxID=3377108 RepID=UPI003B848239